MVFIVFKQNVMTYFSMFLSWNMTPDMFLTGFVWDFPWEFFVSRTISLYADPIMIRDSPLIESLVKTDWYYHAHVLFIPTYDLRN